KRKWMKSALTVNEYLEAIHDLRIAAWGNEIEVQEYGLADPFIQKDVDRIVQTYRIDVSDALQLLTVLHGPHSGLVGPSASVLVTADCAWRRPRQPRVFASGTARRVRRHLGHDTSRGANDAEVRRVTGART